MRKSPLELMREYDSVIPDRILRRRLLAKLHAAIQRCHNPNVPGYMDYGWRGVYVCDEWRTNKVEFLKYAITLEFHDFPEYELDRIDSKKGYEPGNIQFIDNEENVKRIWWK